MTGDHPSRQPAPAAGELVRQGHRLCQLGAGLLLLISIQGFCIPLMVAPGMGVSAHLLGALEGTLLLALGLLWPRLALGALGSRVAFFGAAYSAVAILIAYMIAAITGAGIETLSLSGAANGLSRGTAAQEAAVRWTAYSSAPADLASLALVCWGLRRVPASGGDR